MAQTLLVADDSKTMQRIVTMAFEGSPFRVVAVGSGAEALQAAYEHRPSAILLDYHLPDRSGLDVCRALKGDPSLREIPVVLMGGSYHPFSEDDARRQGSDDVILKPFRTDQILDKIRSVTGAHGPQTAMGMPAVSAPAPVPPVVTPLPRPAAPVPGAGFVPGAGIPGRTPGLPAAPRAPLIPPLPGGAPSVPSPSAQAQGGFELPSEPPRPRSTMMGMPSVAPVPGQGNTSTFPGAPAAPSAAAGAPSAPRYGGRLPPPVGVPGAAPLGAPAAPLGAPAAPSRYPGAAPSLPVTPVVPPVPTPPQPFSSGGSGALPMPEAFSTQSAPSSVPSQGGGSQLGASQPSIPSAPLQTATLPGAAQGVDRELLRQLVREEVQSAVRTEMLAMVKSVLGDLFKEKMLPKLLSYGQERIETVVVRDLQSIMERRVEEELQKLTNQ